MKAYAFPGERRLYTRITKRIPVNIHYNGHCIARCFTGNIGIGGALVDVQDLGLTKNALVEVSFGVNTWHALHKVKIPAIVVWCDEKHIAVSFELLRKDTEELMQDHIDSILLEPDSEIEPTN